MEHEGFRRTSVEDFTVVQHACFTTSDLPVVCQPLGDPERTVSPMGHATEVESYAPKINVFGWRRYNGVLYF